MIANSTPEEKLLNLIKKGQTSVKLKKDLNIFTKINIALIAIIAIVCSIFLLDIFVFNKKALDLPQVNQLTESAVQPISGGMRDNIPAEGLHENADSLSYDDPSRKSLIDKESIRSNLNLLGIVSGEDNQAIIEDKNLKKTYFLYKGDSLSEMKVLDITGNSVILDYKGEKIELNI